MTKTYNINKIIFTAIARGFNGEPKTTSLAQIQDWIINTYNVVPCVTWDTKYKLWKAYVYDYDYDSFSLMKRIKQDKPNLSTKEVTNLIDKYVKTKFVVTDKNGSDRFTTCEEALATAINIAFNNTNGTKDNR